MGVNEAKTAILENRTALGIEFHKDQGSSGR